jgi:outer membrane assembly lipoprotein YfiO
MMNILKKIVFSLLVLGLVGADVFAQGSYRPQADDFEATVKDGPQQIDKKTPSYWRRPAQPTPAEQLAYAQAQEAGGHKRRAERQYNALVHRWHQSAEAPLAQFAYARLLYERGRYERAFREFQYMVQFFSGQFDYNLVLDYQRRIGNQILGKRWATFGIFRGFESPERALPMLETIVRNAPNWEKTPAIRLNIALVYENAGEHESAIKAYESVIQAHPGSPEAQTAAYRQAACLTDLSDKHPRDERHCRDALSSLASFLAVYPQGEQRAEAQQRLDSLKSRLEEMYYQRARYYDKIEKRPAAALVSYRDFLKRFPASDRAPAILERIGELEQQEKAGVEDNIN